MGDIIDKEYSIMVVQWSPKSSSFGSNPNTLDYIKLIWNICCATFQYLEDIEASLPLKVAQVVQL